MAPITYLLTLFIPIGAIVAIFVILSVASIAKAKARLANDDAYRKLAQTAAAAQGETVAALAAIQEALAEVRVRLGAVEKVLKDVE